MPPGRMASHTGEGTRSKLIQRAKNLPVITAPDLAQKVPPLDFLIRGVWPLGSHGPIAGRKKALKSYTALAVDLAVASGKSFLGNDDWKIPHARPVIIFAGEGGEHLIRRRLQRIAHDVYGIRSIARLPIVVLPATPKFGTDQFAGYLLRAIDALGETPGLVTVDSVYNYHPSSREVQVSNVYDRGPMLSEVSHLVYEWCGADSVLQFVDHFRSTGDGRLDLDSISQAGMAEFADTWMLIGYHATPDPDAGLFPLRVEIGSRQDWPGAGYQMDWDIGRFDIGLGEWVGSISVDVSDCDRAVTVGGKAGASDDEISGGILDCVEANEWQLTKDQIISAVAKASKVGDKRVRTAFMELATAKPPQLVSDKRERSEGSTMKTRELWALGDPKLRQRS
jgi:hypothetical protein